jgi:hypothetical protein
LLNLRCARRLDARDQSMTLRWFAGVAEKTASPRHDLFEAIFATSYWSTIKKALRSKHNEHILIRFCRPGTDGLAVRAITAGDYK